MGSGTDGHEKLARAVGRALAKLGVNLLTGGGGGVMTSVSRAFVQAPRRRGVCIGVIPCGDGNSMKPKAGYPNPFVELAIRTHLPLSGKEGTALRSRNHINVLTSTCIVVLPGGAGTASEVALARKYGKPVVVFSPDPVRVRHFPRQAPRVTTIDEVIAFVRRHVGGKRA